MPDPAASAAANHGLGFIHTELHKKIKDLRSAREACDNLERELKMFAAHMDDVIRRDAGTSVHRARGEVMRELLHDMEDCKERYMYRITRLDDAKWLPRMGGMMKTLFARNRFVKKIKKLNQRAEQAGVDHTKSTTGEAAAPAGGGRGPIQEDPVGFAKAKEEVLTLLDEVVGEPMKLRVIAIVGFGGSGKTTLASAVYTSPAVPTLRAWVDRRHYKDAPSLLKRIILEFWPEDGRTTAQSSDDMVLQRYLKDHIKNERYLIILDDMDMKLWQWIDLTFKDKGISSRIIVTTSFLSTAFQCSSSSNQQRGDGYVYRMRSLCHEGSQTLARLNEIAHDSCPYHHGQCQCPLETLQKKCDGLPLALVSAAKHFNSIRRGRPTIGDCKTLCNDLGSYLIQKEPDNVAATEGVQSEPFADLRGVLTNNYTSLAYGTLGDCCLLYLGISPDARRLKRNKITRRWVAQGYGGLSADPEKSEQKRAEEVFQKLIELNIVQPVGICTSRTCKALGIVHEYVLHKSMSEKFIMTTDSAEQSRASTRKKKQKSRHLFVRGGNVTSSRATVSMDLSHVRSLTVVTVTATNEGNNLRSGSACDGFLKFRKYRLLRVLDLEECTEVNNSHLASICSLWNLRYLSLSGEVNKLPNEIKKLKLLERLQLSKTKVTELPVEIVGMPSLKHLIGRFMLLGMEPSAELVENNMLETLSGMVADREQGFLRLVPYLKNLRKVSVCFDQCSRNILDLRDLLLTAIKGYLKRRLEHGFSRSLSIDFKSLYGMRYESYPQYAMEQLHSLLSSNNCYLTSLKLHDRLLSPWPQFVALLSGLTKLCLSLNSLTNDLLSAISELQHTLEHLKLIADEIPQDLVIQEGKFKSLQSLCFVVRGPNGSIPQIQIHGALPQLRYFQLISKFLARNLCGIQIRNLTQLQEIELHPDVSNEARHEWEMAAGNHPNRPDVLPLRGVDDPVVTITGNALDQEPAVDPVAGGADAPEQSPIITTTATSHEPTQIPFAVSSTPTNDESSYPADSVITSAPPEDAVASTENVADNGLELTTVQNMAFANNHVPSVERDKPSDKPIAAEQEASDISIPAQPVGESSNRAQVNNASNGVPAVGANGHGHDR